MTALKIAKKISKTVLILFNMEVTYNHKRATPILNTRRIFLLEIILSVVKFFLAFEIQCLLIFINLQYCRKIQYALTVHESRRKISLFTLSPYKHKKFHGFQSASELYRSSDRRQSANITGTLSERETIPHVWEIYKNYS
jgi:hypothetical protein